MPDKYIVNMTEKTAPEDTNLLVIEDAVDTKKITFANLFKPIKNMIGNLASLTTSHKSTIVGAINELEANNSLRVVCHGQLTKTVNMAVGASDYWTVPRNGPDADIYLAYIGTRAEDAQPFAVSTGRVYSSGVIVNYQCLRAYNGEITFGFIGIKIF